MIGINLSGEQRVVEHVGVTLGDRSRKKHRIRMARTWPYGSLKAEVIEANESFCGRKIGAWVSEEDAVLIEPCKICYSSREWLRSRR